MRNYYEILEVSRTASQETIKRMYKYLAQKYHPDVNKSEDAEEYFKWVVTAYEVLGDVDSRSQYDAELYWEEQNQSRQEHSFSQADDRKESNADYFTNTSNRYTDYQQVSPSKSQMKRWLHILAIPAYITFYILQAIRLFIKFVIIYTVMKAVGILVVCITSVVFEFMFSNKELSDQLLNWVESHFFFHWKIEGCILILLAMILSCVRMIKKPPQFDQ
ncbi:hypothetical protein BVE84_03875 [Streptococcus azizii]|uniref:J domain-containing protein n=1 Tax=Streptococcus azizii TaxID=1579424 RepID=A0AB36JRR7_9STRE|nr:MULTISPECIES: DnaJ domain-containing protein [Streptococcus]MBF0775468.1 DnaJ domain-containing protein [Streptococcus sp. 19428wD3_AN2]ONK28343.1 hypothetical protein BVE86_03050 [Streptococcus azizii]ONK28969.1 hypothetical protein BVE85_03780 [Streptococcus azizii]ONK30206.1 hypothetical protein BVE84_03875 [Streptococcus azizii]TFU84633.1 hypothetical protein E4T83_01570 [Streptococcus sp. AN2]